MEKKSLIVNRYMKNGIHLEDDWNRPIYFIKKEDRTHWLCDVNCGSGNPSIHYVNSGNSYNYDLDPDYAVAYTGII